MAVTGEDSERSQQWDMIEDLVEAIDRLSEVMSPAVNVQAPAVSVSPRIALDEAAEWEFTVERDKGGRIEKIKARKVTDAS